MAREIWEVAAPAGGWARPWPQCVELARKLSPEQWTLVGGLMVQLHAAAAGLTVTRPTADVDIVLHIETGTTTGEVQQALGELGYTLEPSIDHAAPAHRFLRGKDQIDVMIADHAGPDEKMPRLGGRKAFKISGGTQALQRTVNCRVTVPGEEPVLISVPNTLGALVLKGAAYREDSRDIRRHLDDAAVLLATVTDPLGMSAQMKGSDRSRIRALQAPLADPIHESWLHLDDAYRQPAKDALAVLAADPPSPCKSRPRLGRRI